ncbi:MAG: ABC transporter permease subunit [Pseudomonadota bacterium]
MIGHVLAIARTELRLGIRNRWVLLATLMLLTFALVLGLIGTAPTGTLATARLVVTLASLATLSVYLVPLIALLVSFDAIAGEVDRGTLPILLATPVSRTAVVLGKFLGHLVVIALAVTIGYGVASGVILALSGGTLAEAEPLLALIGLSILLGAAFLGVGYAVSVLGGSVGTAAALAVGTRLVAAVLCDLALLGALVAAPESFFAKTLSPYLLLTNPADAFRLFALSDLDIGGAATGFAGVAQGLPLPPVAALASLILWTAMALAAAALAIRRIQP